MLSDANAVNAPDPFNNSSGMGPGAQVPPEILKWNWGAFLLNWVWAIGNSTYIGLLTFVPVIGWFVPFVLGAKGSRWAWQNRRWASVAEYQRAQRQWAQTALVLMAVFVGTAVLGVYMVIAGYKHTNLYKMAIESIEVDDQLREEVGDPYTVAGTSFNFTGTTASVDFDVTGPNRTAAVRVYLEKIKGTWAVVDSVLLDDDTNEEDTVSGGETCKRQPQLTVRLSARLASAKSGRGLGIKRVLSR